MIFKKITVNTMAADVLAVQEAGKVLNLFSWNILVSSPEWLNNWLLSQAGAQHQFGISHQLKQLSMTLKTWTEGNELIYLPWMHFNTQQHPTPIIVDPGHQQSHTQGHIHPRHLSHARSLCLIMWAISIRLVLFLMYLMTHEMNLTLKWLGMLWKKYFLY